MSKNQRRAKINKRAAARRPRQNTAPNWPDTLSKFVDWILESDCAAHSSTAYAAAMAVDRWARGQGIVVVGSELPLTLFEFGDYTSFYSDWCEHSPWTEDDCIVALDLFCRFVVAENLAPSHSQTITDQVDCDTPPRPLPEKAVPPRLSTPIGPLAITSNLQRIAGGVRTTEVSRLRASPTSIRARKFVVGST